jgi:hypothetical protein
MSGRNLIVAPGTETEMLKLDTFTEANKVGDDGTALREASLGRKLGFDIFMCQNVPDPTTAVSTLHADELGTGGSKGDLIWAVDDGTICTAGQYVVIEGDLQPFRITAINTNNWTMDRPLRTDIAVGTSDITEFLTNTVDLAGHAGVTSYPTGYAKRIKIDDDSSTTAVPIQGQLISFSSGATLRSGEYRIIRVILDSTDYYILLDRPLDAALSDNDIVNYGPNGDYNFAFHRNALSLVSRPLAQPRSGTGALSGVANFNDLSVRVTITYNGTAQGHLVTLDILAGVKVLDEDLGAVMLG